MEETTNTFGIGSLEDAPEALTIAEKLAANVAGALAPRTIGNATMLTLPDGYSVKDITDSIEAAQPHRNRAKGTVLLSVIIIFMNLVVDVIVGYLDPRIVND